MYTVVYTSRMRKDVRRMKRRGKDISKLINVLNLLKENDEPLPEKYYDHQLEGDFNLFAQEFPRLYRRRDELRLTALQSTCILNELKK